MGLLRGIELDRSRHPLVVVRYGRVYSDEELELVLSGVAELVRHGPFVMINDTRGGPMPSPVQRRLLIDFYTLHDREIRQNFRAVAIVGDSTLVRGVLTALQWVRPAPHPTRIFASAVEAEAWALAHLSEPLRRVPPTPGTER